MIVRGDEIVDALHRNEHWFARKRLSRMPREFTTNEDYLRRVKQQYDRDGVAAALIDHVESLAPGPDWRGAEWP